MTVDKRCMIVAQSWHKWSLLSANIRPIIVLSLDFVYGYFAFGRSHCSRRHANLYPRVYSTSFLNTHFEHSMLVFYSRRSKKRYARRHKHCYYLLRATTYTVETGKSMRRMLFAPQCFTDLQRDLA